MRVYDNAFKGKWKKDINVILVRGPSQIWAYG